MKQICGFKGLDDQFYETEKECILADANFKVKSLYDTLDDLPRKIEREIFFNYRSADRVHNWSKYSDLYLNMVAEVILRDSDKFIDIINQKKALEKELDYLEKQKNKPWWLKTIWWKK